MAGTARVREPGQTREPCGTPGSACRARLTRREYSVEPMRPSQLEAYGGRDLAMEARMPQPGRVLLNRVTGQRLIFRRTAAQTRGRILELELVYPPGGRPPPDHLHPEQEATLEVLEGTLQARVDGRPRPIAAGDVLVLQAGARHAVWNPGPAEARAVWLTYPALASEALLETLWALGQLGRTDRRGSPDLFQTAVLLRAYSREIQLAWPPWLVQRAVLAALAPLGRGLGCAAHLAYEADPADR
jgi:quercetin dioxygenase-like cupin family protein